MSSRMMSSVTARRAKRFKDVQVSLGKLTVMPLFVEDDQQALSHRVAAGCRPARSIDGLGVALQRLVGQPVDDLAESGRPVTAQLQDRIERRPRVAIARHSGRVGHLVPWQIQRVPRGRIAEDGPPDPAVAGEDKVAQRLYERPFAVDRLVEQLWRQTAGVLDG